MTPHELNENLGNMDLFLLDQVLKGRFQNSQKILDAGCGEGRNSYYFLKNNFSIYGVDRDPNAIRLASMMARTHNKALSHNFLEEKIESLPFPDKFFDAVICCSVLHFAADEEHFQGMINEMDRILKPGGYFFIRMIDRPEEGIPFPMTSRHIDGLLDSGFEWVEEYKSVIEKTRSLNVIMLVKKT